MNSPLYNLPVIELNDDLRLDASIINKMGEILNREGISKIHYFLTQCVTHLSIHLNNEATIEDIELISTNMNSLKSHFMGCEEYCPLCRRQCDKEHDVNENVAKREHSCTKGH